MCGVFSWRSAAVGCGRQVLGERPCLTRKPQTVAVHLGFGVRRLLSISPGIVERVECLLLLGEDVLFGLAPDDGLRFDVMLDAAAHRPHDRDALAVRLRDGQF